MRAAIVYNHGVRVLLPLLALLTAGCVRRTLQIETDPPGADIVVDFSEAGISPYNAAFFHYGTRRVEARLNGYETLIKDVTVRPPWHEWFPLELLSEIAVPWMIHDARTVTLKMTPLNTREEALLERAEEARRFEWKKP